MRRGLLKLEVGDSCPSEPVTVRTRIQTSSCWRLGRAWQHTSPRGHFTKVPVGRVALVWNSRMSVKSRWSVCLWGEEGRKGQKILWGSLGMCTRWLECGEGRDGLETDVHSVMLVLSWLWNNTATDPWGVRRWDSHLSEGLRWHCCPTVCFAVPSSLLFYFCRRIHQSMRSLLSHPHPSSCSVWLRKGREEGALHRHFRLVSKSPF